MNFFIYVLKDPTTNEIRYVGKTPNIKTRLQGHISASKHGGSHRKNWIKSLLDQNLKPLIEVLDSVEKEESSALEIAYIAFFRENGYRLVNSTDGGEGTVGWKHPDEIKEKIKKSNLGQKRSEKTRKNVSVSLVGNSRAKLGKLRKDNKSGYKNISWYSKSKSWLSRYRRKHLGYFKSISDAVFAYSMAYINHNLYGNRAS
jgi:hypothetical protein